MKKLFLIICTLCLGLTLAFGVAACGEDEKKDAPSTVPVVSVTLDKTSLELEVDETFTLTATVNPSNATDKTVVWTSSAPSVATVTGGKIFAMSAGTADISAAAGGKEAVCSVTVSEKSVPNIPVNSITLNRNTLNLEVGSTFTLITTVLPANATNKTVSWKSSSASVTVSDRGLVTAVSGGTATVTATADGKSASCSVTVSEKVVVEEITLSENSVELTAGDSKILTASVEPADGNVALSWKSSDEAVATVDGSGKITAVAAGNATVTVSAGDKQATCSVKVNAKIIPVTSVTLNKTEVKIYIGLTEVLRATVLPSDATNLSVAWKSSNEDVATVTNGAVLAKSKGTAQITATAGGKSAVCVVTVTDEIFVPVTGITLNRSDLELRVEETFTLTATIAPLDATEREIVWSSSNSGVATVEGGLVTAKAVGTAKITAKIGNIEAVCEVGVIAKQEEIPPIPDDSILTYAHAGEESAAFEWKDTAASGAKVEYKLSTAASYTAIDKQLIRQISDTAARADILGLKGGAKYDFKITSSDGKAAYAKGVDIAAYDRSGYAHQNFSGGVGAYKDDGTLKQGATVIYVTEENKNNVDGKGNSIAEYLTAQKNNKNPIVVRIIGTVGSATWNEIEYNAKGHEGDDITVDKVVGANGKKLPTDNDLLTQAALISGGYNTLNEYPAKLNGAKCVAIDGLISKAKYTAATDKAPAEYDSAWNDCQIQNVSNITVEGVGEDAEIFQWGFTFKSCNSVEVRNLRFFDYTEDACSFEGSENSTTLSGFEHKNFWLHHNTFDIGVNYWDVCPEQDKHDGDGSTDFKYLAYVTIAYNVYNGTHKTGLVGGGDSAHQACFTFHHNYYNGCDQRMPLGRQANMHMYNNYYSGSGLYSISLRAGAYAFIENCVFTSGKSSTSPIELRSGSNGTPSCKVINCDMEGSISNAYKDANNVYIGNDRTATVNGENLYGQNFDTKSGFYTVTDMLETDEVATVIPRIAGVMKRSSNIKIDAEEEPPEVIDPPVNPDNPSDGQSVSYSADDEGTAFAVDGRIADGELFAANWNSTKSAVTKGFSAATADDNSDKTFEYALLSNGTGGGITITAKKAITLTIYYGASDSKFTTQDQSKSGNLVWSIAGGNAVTSTKTENKSNKVAYSETISLSAGQEIVFTVSANRFVLYGLFAE